MTRRPTKGNRSGVGTARVPAAATLAAGLALALAIQPVPACETNPDGDRECSTNLLILWDALQEHRARHGDWPAKLSDLRGQFLADRGRLFCPLAHGETSVDTTSGIYRQDDTGTSYSYEFGLTPLYQYPGKTMRDWKRLQMAKVGGAIPILRCPKHGDRWLNLSVEGKLWRSGVNWEESLVGTFEREQLNEKFLFSEQAEGEPARWFSIPARHPGLPATAIDFGEHYSAPLAPSWDIEIPGNDLEVLGNATGVVGLFGIDFDVRGVIQLAGKGRLDGGFQRSSVGIGVGTACRKLHFLHGCAYGDRKRDDGKPLAKLVVHLEGRPPVEQELVYGLHVSDWWDDPNDIDLAPGTRVGWQGKNNAIANVSLYLTTGRPGAASPRCDKLITLLPATRPRS